MAMNYRSAGAERARNGASSLILSWRFTARALLSMLLFLTGLGAGSHAAEPAPQAGDPDRGKTFFQLNCAICHATSLGPRNVVFAGQGPSLVGVVGRRAASVSNFSYSKALGQSGLVWDTATMDRFLAAPMTAVPGTTMLISVPGAEDRRNLIAFLSTLVAPAGASTVAQPGPSAASDAGDWRHDAPGLKHSMISATLPEPFSTVPPETDRRWLAGRRLPPCPCRRASRFGCSPRVSRGPAC